MNWKRAIALMLGLVVVLGIAFKLAIRREQPPAHQVFINGVVITMDGENRVAEALSVRGEHIDAVGSTQEILAGKNDNTVVIDLAGATLLPGFIDAHGHFPGSGLAEVAADLNSPPIGTITNMSELLATMREQVAGAEPGEWVGGFGYDDTLLAERRHPTRAELDSVSSEHPIALLHISGHMVVANSMALELAGIDATTPNPEGGVIGRRPGTQEPNGLLEETARSGVLEKMQNFGVRDGLNMIASAGTAYAAVGVTTAQSGGVPPGLARALAMASRMGLVDQRLVLFPMEEAYGESLLNGEYNPAQLNDDRVLMSAVKIIADGSIQGYTGYLTKAYHTAYHGDVDYRGYPTVSREALFEKVSALHKAGYQLAIHGNGDASIDDILDAFAAAQAEHPVDDPRLILIHAQMAREDQVKRMKELGVTPSFFTAHTWYWGDRHRDVFMGQTRAAQISPHGWAQQYGVRFSSHLDTPVVPMQPLQAVWSQVHRMTYGGDVLGPEQRIDVMSALRAVTIDAAWQVFQEEQLGSLEVGKLADLVILAGNPLTSPMAMRNFVVQRTVIGGVTVYQAP